MWYNTIPPFIPMDPNMYSMYYPIIKVPDPLISGRKENYAFDIIQAESMPHVEYLE
jgi:hypothetical protein